MRIVFKKLRYAMIQRYNDIENYFNFQNVWYNIYFAVSCFSNCLYNILIAILCKY